MTEKRGPGVLACSSNILLSVLFFTALLLLVWCLGGVGDALTQRYVELLGAIRHHFGPCSCVVW